jgi:hypothetical protein
VCLMATAGAKPPTCCPIGLTVCSPNRPIPLQAADPKKAGECHINYMLVRGYFIPLKTSPFVNTLRTVTGAKKNDAQLTYNCDICGAIVEQYDWKCPAFGESESRTDFTEIGLTLHPVQPGT